MNKDKLLISSASVLGLILCFILVSYFIWLFNLAIYINNSTEDVYAIDIQETTVDQEQLIYDKIIDNDPYKEYIYFTESSFTPDNIYQATKEVNDQSGKAGICQLQNGTENDVWNQDELCTEYMISRYGSWQEAYEFHKENGWW